MDSVAIALNEATFIVTFRAGVTLSYNTGQTTFAYSGAPTAEDLPVHAFPASHGGDGGGDVNPTGHALCHGCGHSNPSARMAHVCADCDEAEVSYRRPLVCYFFFFSFFFGRLSSSFHHQLFGTFRAIALPFLEPSCRCWMVFPCCQEPRGWGGATTAALSSAGQSLAAADAPRSPPRSPWCAGPALAATLRPTCWPSTIRRRAWPTAWLAPAPAAAATRSAASVAWKAASPTFASTATTACTSLAPAPTALCVSYLCACVRACVVATRLHCP